MFSKLWQSVNHNTAFHLSVHMGSLYRIYVSLKSILRHGKGRFLNHHLSLFKGSRLWLFFFSLKFRAGDTGLFLIFTALATLRQMTRDTNPLMELNAFQAP